MAIKQRTPFIKPRVQGGTFYTFGSALEDIGLNINEANNKVSLSHYILLDIPFFGNTDNKKELDVNTEGRTYTGENEGDCVFADYFQNAILNMETVLRNDSGYNYASPHTVSERVFWKWLFKDLNIEEDFIQDGGYFYQSPELAFAKSFGRIVSGSQRVDSEGIYNETFVQIPSSYGQMRVLFKQVSDENFSKNRTYTSSNGMLIEGIESGEYDDRFNIKSTGIPALGRFDKQEGANGVYNCMNRYEQQMQFEVEFDTAKLSEYYNNQEGLTYDEIGFGNVERNGSIVAESSTKNFNFNAILVYYSVYDTSGKTLLSTNAFGLYILGNSSKSGDLYLFPEFSKTKASNTQTGTSFSFRLNIKPTSAYSGDVVVSDNSTTAFADSTDFNDIIKNLSTATEILKTNARVLNKIVNDNQDLKTFAKEAIEKVDDISKTVAAITTDSSIYDTLATNTMLMRTYGNATYSIESIADEILSNTSVTFDNSQHVAVNIETSSLGADASVFAEGMVRKIDGKDYIDLTKMVCLLIAKTNLYHS